MGVTLHMACYAPASIKSVERVSFSAFRHIEFVVMFIINLTGLPLRVRGCTEEEGADL